MGRYRMRHWYGRYEIIDDTSDRAMCYGYHSEDMALIVDVLNRAYQQVEDDQKTIEQGGSMNIKLGGLARCCIKTLEIKQDDLQDAKEGDKITCMYCNDSIIFHNNSWQWDSPFCRK